MYWNTGELLSCVSIAVLIFAASALTAVKASAVLLATAWRSVTTLLAASRRSAIVGGLDWISPTRLPSAGVQPPSFPHHDVAKTLVPLKLKVVRTGSSPPKSKPRNLLPFVSQIAI